MRRRLATAIGLAAGLASASAPAAGAARLVTWTTHSRAIDLAQQHFNSPPPGAPARKGALRVDVLLPDGYDGRRRFPVLWLLHGHGDAYDYWANPQRGDLLAAARVAHLRAIVVMPEGAEGWYTDWYAGGKRGAGFGWETYHLDELLPLTERRLRIRAGRRWHAIAGLSMGGEGAAYYAAQVPGYFGTLGTFSGALSLERPEWPTGFNTQGQDFETVYGPQSGPYARGHDPVALAGNLAATRTFVSVGDGVPSSDPAQVRNLFGQVAERELRFHAQDFVAALQKAGASVTYHPHQGIHDWPYWRADLVAFLRWGPFRPVPARPTRWSFGTVRRAGDAWGVRFSFTRPPATMETLTRDGRMLRAAGSGTVRITVGRRSFTARLPFARRVF